MEDNVKKILDKLYLDFEKAGLTAPEYSDLRDYITNLQIIEQQYSAILSENAELENKITNLQEENEFLKLNNPDANIEHFRVVGENKRKINNLRAENKKLKDELERWKKKYGNL